VGDLCHSTCGKVGRTEPVGRDRDEFFDESDRVDDHLSGVHVVV